MSTTRSTIAGFAAALALCGCLSPERAVREARETGSAIAGDYLEQVTGRTNEFTIARPADRLRNRLLAEQGLKPELAAALAAGTGAVVRATLPDPLVLSLADALRAGAANSEEFQGQKETVFDAALALDLQRHAFENTFAGALGGGWSGTESGGGKEKSAAVAVADGEAAVSGGGRSKSSQASGDASASVSRKLANGMTLAASLGLDVVRLLTGGSGSTLGLKGDASVTMPLLRGFGRDIVREPLTQAERNLLYAIYAFEGYRQSFAIKVATDYYGMSIAASWAGVGSLMNSINRPTETTASSAWFPFLAFRSFAGTMPSMKESPVIKVRTGMRASGFFANSLTIRNFLTGISGFWPAATIWANSSSVFAVCTVIS